MRSCPCSWFGFLGTEVSQQFRGCCQVCWGCPGAGTCVCPSRGRTCGCPSQDSCRLYACISPPMSLAAPKSSRWDSLPPAAGSTHSSQLQSWIQAEVCAWMEQTQGFRDLLGFDGAPLPGKHWEPSAEHICNGITPQLCSQEGFTGYTGTE